jgi:hypothetical protein
LGEKQKIKDKSISPVISCNLQEPQKITEREILCFLQVKTPHFCRTFSPGTGGEFLC